MIDSVHMDWDIELISFYFPLVLAVLCFPYNHFNKRFSEIQNCW